MEIAFGSRELRRLCETEGSAVDALGAEMAATLLARLADLDAAASPLELIDCQFHSETQPASLVLGLGEGSSIECHVNHQVAPCDEHGALIWSRVRRIKIVRVAGSGYDFS